MIGAGRSRGGGRIGGGNSPPRPPHFRSEAEHAKWVRSKGVRKRSARRWTNWGLTPPGKLERYANSGEGCSSGSSGGSCRPPLPPIPDSSSEDEDGVPPLQLSSGDFVHDDPEEAAVIQQVTVISEAEARLRFLHEEQANVRRVMAYEAAQREARVRRVKLEVVALDEEKVSSASVAPSA